MFKKNKIYAMMLLTIFMFLITMPNVMAIDYGNICGESEVKTTVIIIGTFVQILKILVPIIIIGFGMVDYVKAVISSDDSALSKATSGLIRRIIAGIVVFFIPTLILTFINMTNIAGNTESTFEACTTCILDVSECRD